MNEERQTTSDYGEPGHPVGPEVDDSGNPTAAAPEEATGGTGQGGMDQGAPAGEGPRAAAGREMLVQLQQMIDTLATQAAPVMREVAAKAAELAAIAGEKAGPIAHRAAGVTETVGQRVAARSKEMAAEFRRGRETGGEERPPASSEGSSDESRERSDFHD